MPLSPKTIEAALVGFAVGDALGVPVEFRHRSELRRDPVTGMRGFQVHHQPPGTWSDDSALTFQLVENLMEGYDPETLGRRFVHWFLHGDWSARGNCFDIGIATRSALHRIEQGTPALEAGESGEYSNGNGALMRILPLAFTLLKEENQAKRFEKVREVARITHGHVRSAMGSFFFVEIVRQLLRGLDKHEAYRVARLETADFLVKLPAPASELDLYRRVLFGNIAELPETEIYSSGYVIHTLEAALWSFLTTDNFRDATLRAVNLGDDTDTVAALTGGLAGIAYGPKSIPANWLTVLARLDDIRDLARRFAEWLNSV
jgi:ADP-ribosylglycohydrolase